MTSWSEAAQPSVRVLEDVYDVGFERMAVRLAKQPIGLRLGETQLVATKFGQFAAGPKAGDGKTRRPPAYHDHLELRRCAVYQPIHHRADAGNPIRNVVVVKDQGRGDVAQAVDLGEQGSEDCFIRAWLDRGFGQEGSASREQPGIDRLACRHQVAEEHQAVRVVVVQAIPECSNPRAPQDVSDEGRLAVACLGRDVDHPAVGARVKPVEKAVPAKRLAGQQRPLDLARAQRKAGRGARHDLDHLVADLGFDGHPGLLHPSRPTGGG